jgi:3-methyladenine DNA glycosylase AlkC
MMTTAPQPDATLKNKIFSAERVKHIAAEMQAVCGTFDSAGFLAKTMGTLEALSLMERLRHVTESLHAALPLDFRPAVAVLRQLAPRLDSRFVTMVLSDFVAVYGTEDFEVSMDALRFFTTFGSSEFAIRHFLRRDLARTLSVMESWSRDENEHVRRLASEGSRPRLPWSFRIEPLIIDPALTASILANLRADSSLYVRKSVANHLNDITKDNPAWALECIRGWPLDNPRTAWIAGHALRGLIKKGSPDALAIVGAVTEAKVELSGLAVSPRSIRLGEVITLSFRLRSTSDTRQKLVVDYAVHYVRGGGRISRKVFKLKTLMLDPGASEVFRRRQSIRNLSTRAHHAGRHEVEVMVNGQILGRTSFELSEQGPR